MNHTFPNISDFPVLEDLTKTFPKAEVYLVGGAVRDCVRGKKFTDYDMVVRNVAGGDLENFLATRGRVVFAGKNFGVWKFSEVGSPDVYDIALPRTEFSMHKQGIYKDFSVQTDPHLPIESDLARRDFTINAMALNLATGALIDPHHGKIDLEEKRIRTVGASEDRFQEDYSRMLRALRFSIQLDFTIEQKTYNALTRMITMLNTELDDHRVVPHEIIAEEFLKSLAADPVTTLARWHESGALAEIAPELLQMRDCPQPPEYHYEGDVWEHTRLALAALASDQFRAEFGSDPAELELVLAVLFHDVGKPYTLMTPREHGTERIRFNEHEIVGAKIARTVLERIKISAPPDRGVDPARVSWLVQHHMIIMHGDPETLRPTTIEKYFFNTAMPSRNLLKLIFVDGLATIGPNGNGFTDRYEKLRNRMRMIQERTGSRGFRLVEPLINGHDVMTIRNLKPGELIGGILDAVRHEQLQGAITNHNEAIAFVTHLDLDSLA